jgi:hypothetical protein
MSLETFWTKLAGRQQSREKGLAERWRSAIVAIADGKPPKEEETDKLLSETGKSVAELQQAVERFQRRRQARAVVDRGKKIPAEYQQVQTALAIAQSEYEAAVAAADRKFEETYAPLVLKLDGLKRAEQEAIQAYRLLVDTAEDQSASKEAGEMHKRLVDLRPRINRLENQIIDAPRQIRQLRLAVDQSETAKKAFGDTVDEIAKRKKMREDADTYAQKIPAWKSELEALRRESNELQARLDALEASKLEV